MKNSNKYSYRRKVKYELESLISKGIWGQLALLLSVVFVLVIAFACLIMAFTEDLSFGDSIWDSLMHVIDQGTITGDEPENSLHFVLMLVITFVGMAFTSAIVAITASAVQRKVDELNKGRSRIIEKGHTVVLGFNDNTHTIKNEIEDSNSKKSGKHCLVIVDDLPKDEMEHKAKEKNWSSRDVDEVEEEAIKKEKKTNTIFRSGDLVSENTYDICAIDVAESIIVNGKDDFETIKILLSLSNYLKKSGAYIGSDHMPSIVAMIHDDENLSAAKIAAGVSRDKGLNDKKRKQEYKVRILYFKEIFARLFARVCAQPGLTLVMNDLLNSDNASFYIDDEHRAEWEGKSITEIQDEICDAIAVGFSHVDNNRQTKMVLNPVSNIKYAKDDVLVYIADNKENLKIKTGDAVQAIAETATDIKNKEVEKKRFLLMGNNVALTKLLTNISTYDADKYDVDAITPQGIGCEGGAEILDDPYNWEHTKKHLDDHPYWFDENDNRHLTNIIILSPIDIDDASADEKVIVLLLNFREYIAKHCNYRISITSEAKLPQNQALVQNMSGNDFVVGIQIANRFLVQIADDPMKYYIFDELLKKQSNAIILREFSSYVDTTKPFNFEGIYRQIKTKNEAEGKQDIPIGWIKLDENLSEQLELCPSSEKRGEIFVDEDNDNFRNYRVVIIA